MNLDQMQHTLAEIANSGDPTFSNFAKQVNEIVEQAKSGQLSNSEVAEILKDAHSQLIILEDMSQMAFKEKLHTVLAGLVTLAGVV